MSDSIAAPALQLRTSEVDLDTVDDDTLIRAALARLDARFVRTGKIESPADSKAYFALQLAAHDREVFAVLFVDAQHQILAFREMFFGTLTQASVYPREIVRVAMLLNAAGVVLGHQHPSSGNPEPSRADEVLTKAIVEALRLVDVRVLDHLVVGGGQTVSMAERGLL
jgi:DNA repair protein RadC